jgi:hypothetical protein
MHDSTLTLAALAEAGWYEGEEVPCGDLEDIDRLLSELGLFADEEAP